MSLLIPAAFLILLRAIYVTCQNSSALPLTLGRTKSHNGQIAMRHFMK